MSPEVRPDGFRRSGLGVSLGAPHSVWPAHQTTYMKGRFRFAVSLLVRPHGVRRSGLGLDGHATFDINRGGRPVGTAR